MRSFSEIYNRLAAEKNTFSELNGYVVNSTNPPSTLDNADQLLSDLKSDSKVGVWRLMLSIFATGSRILEGFFELHKKETTAILESKRPHTLRWYAEESKKYQYGHSMIWNNNLYSYSQILPDAQIIKYAAAVERNGRVILKVAKEINGNKTQLSAPEKAAFAEFWSKWKDAGVKLEIISQPADVLKVNLTIIRDRMVLNEDSSLMRDPTVFPVDNALAGYGSNLEFNSTIVISKLLDAIQESEGVVDVKLNGAYHKPDGGNFSEVNMSVEAQSGHFIIALDSTIDYIDNFQVTIQE